MLLLIAAVLGVVLSAGAYGFLRAVDRLQKALYTDLPSGLGFHGAPPWWPLPLLGLAGLLVALIVQYLPGNGGHQPPRGCTPRASRRPPSFPASCWRRWPRWASVR